MYMSAAMIYLLFMAKTGKIRSQTVTILSHVIPNSISLIIIIRGLIDGGDFARGLLGICGCNANTVSCFAWGIILTLSFFVQCVLYVILLKTLDLRVPAFKKVLRM